MTNTHQHHESAWVVDVRALGLGHDRGPGIAHRLEITLPAAGDLRSGVLAVPPGADVTVNVLLETVSEGVLVSGSATADAVGSCARCLRDIAMTITAEFREMYAYADSLTARTTEADEVPRIDDDLIDLGPLVHDELVLSMPTVALCSPDCQGLCPDCGELLESVGPDHRHETIDPRWAALAGLLDTDSGEITERDRTGVSAGECKEK